METFFALDGVGITYCDTTNGCKFAATGFPSINGLSRAPPEARVGGQDIFYAAGQALSGSIYVFEGQADNSLVLTDTIYVGTYTLSLHEYMTF